MGGYLALVAAAGARGARRRRDLPGERREASRRGLRDGRFDVPRGRRARSGRCSPSTTSCAPPSSSTVPLLLLHAEGDEVVPVEHSRALHVAAAGSRLVAVPGGHHRSVQHDPELQALAMRFVRAAVR